MGNIKPSEPCARLGWIAPNGDFYPCAYCAHRSLGFKLVDMLYSKKEQSQDYAVGGDFLERKGWLGIQSFGEGMISHYSTVKPTSAQLSTARRIVMEFVLADSKNVDFNKTLQENPEGYDLQYWSTAPDDKKRFVESLQGSLSYLEGDL